MPDVLSWQPLGIPIELWLAAAAAVYGVFGRFLPAPVQIGLEAIWAKLRGKVPSPSPLTPSADPTPSEALAAAKTIARYLAAGGVSASKIRDALRAVLDQAVHQVIDVELVPVESAPAVESEVAGG